jgi:hypothetical protein
LTKILRTMVVDVALIATVIVVWRNPSASAEAAGNAYRWLDAHLRPFLEGPSQSSPQP